MMDKMTTALVMNNFDRLFPNNASIAISNLKEFIYYKPSDEIDLNIRPGDVVHENTVTFQALKKKQRVAECRDHHLFGLSYYAVSIPLFDEGMIKGAMTAILPRKPALLKKPYLTVKTADRWLPIRFENVIYLESQNRKTHVLSTIGSGTHKHNLTELEYMLPSDIFIRCHRSYIINMNQIEEIHPDSHSTFILIMKNQSRVPVSQSYSKYFREIFCF